MRCLGVPRTCWELQWQHLRLQKDEEGEKKLKSSSEVLWERKEDLPIGNTTKEWENVLWTFSKSFSCIFVNDPIRTQRRRSAGDWKKEREREREREREEKKNVWSVPSNEKWQEEGKNSHRLAQYNPEWNRSPEPSAYPSCSPKESACFEFQKKETTHAKRKKKGSTLVRNETKRREQTESLIAYFHAKASTAPCVSRRTPTPASKCTPPGGIGGK